jgi:hypothetical protein
MLFSRRLAFVWLALGLLAGLAFSAAYAGVGMAQASGHASGFENVVVTPNAVDLEPGKRSSKTLVWIYGGGFVPGTEVSLLVVDSNGVISDITSAASVFPLIANDDGGFATEWKLGRFTRRGVGGERMITLWVVDQSFNNLAAAPIAFCNLNNRDEGDDVPAWCAS